MAYSLDTSGVVLFDGGTLGVISWEGVGQRGGALAHGHIEAMFASLATPPFTDHPHLEREGLCYGETIVGFSDLAPETLARLMADCAAAAEITRRAMPGAELSAEDGRRLWDHRLREFPGPSPYDEELRASLPSVAPYLGDDGKVYLREGGR